MAEMKVLNKNFFDWVIANYTQLEMGLETVKNKKGHFGFPIKSEAKELKKLHYTSCLGCRGAKIDESGKISKSKLEKGENFIKLFKQVKENILLAGGKVPSRLNKLIEEMEKFEEMEG